MRGSLVVMLFTCRSPNVSHIYLASDDLPEAVLPINKNTMVYQAFSYEDINRLITDVLLLYKIKDLQDTIWNGQSFVEWGKTSDIEWEEY